MFKYLLISIAIVPLLLGVSAARGREAAGSRSALRVGWLLYAVSWFGLLYYLRNRWS